MNAKYLGSEILPRGYRAKREIGAGFCCSDWFSNCYAATWSNFGESPGCYLRAVPKLTIICYSATRFHIYSLEYEKAQPSCRHLSQKLVDSNRSHNVMSEKHV
jgi:hypothetical protein